MTVEIIQADTRDLPLCDDSVDLIVTSPPYWSQRSYQDEGVHYDGQIGAEATPGEYIDALIEATREWLRVLEPEGSLWVNLGDKYAGAPSGPRETLHSAHTVQWQVRRGARQAGVPDKSLMGLPWRYAVRCIDDLGLILRAEVIWSKPNCMPESVTDRVRRSHEQWFHFVQQPRYFSAVDEIRDAHTSARPGAGGLRRRGAESYHADSGAGPTGHWDGTVPVLGRLPGSVWEIATQPLKVPADLGVDHFAAFPLEIPRRIIQGWSPPGVCTSCGEGRRPVVAKTYLGSAEERMRRIGAVGKSGTTGLNPQGGGTAGTDMRAQITGYTCACPEPAAPATPATVLDPFGGTGTTALVADVLGRRGISVDASADYCRIAQWRTTNPGERARAMGVPKPEPVMEGQKPLFDGLETS